MFLHLVLAEASHWDTMPPLLADQFRCILPTLPMGEHRIAADADADLSATGLARAVAELLDDSGKVGAHQLRHVGRLPTPDLDPCALGSSIRLRTSDQQGRRVEDRPLGRCAPRQQGHPSRRPKGIKGFGPAVTNAVAAALRLTTLPFLVAWGADDKAFKPALAERFGCGSAGVSAFRRAADRFWAEGRVVFSPLGVFASWIDGFAPSE